MQASAQDADLYYEQVDTNVFRMKPIAPRPRPRILTTFGRIVVVLAVLFALTCLVAAWHLLK
jgi:hypothetical protein